MYNLQYLNGVMAIIDYSSNLNPDLHSLNMFLRSDNPDAIDLLTKINYAVVGALKAGYTIDQAYQEIALTSAYYYLEYYQSNNIVARQDRQLISDGAKTFCDYLALSGANQAPINNGNFTRTSAFINSQPINEAPLSGIESAWGTSNTIPAIKKMSNEEISARVPITTNSNIINNSNNISSIINQAQKSAESTKNVKESIKIITSAKDYIDNYLNRRNNTGDLAPCPIYDVSNTYGFPPIFDKNLYNIQVVYKYKQLFIKLLPKVSDYIMNSENHRNFILSGYVLNQSLNLNAKDATIYDVDMALIDDNRELAKEAQAMLIKENQIENRDYSPFIKEDIPFIEKIKERIVRLQTEALKNAIMNTVPKEVTERKAGGVFNIPSTIEVNRLSDIPEAIRNIRINNNLIDTSFIIKILFKDNELISINDTEVKDVCDLLCETDIGINALSKQMMAAKNNPTIKFLDNNITNALNIGLHSIIQVDWKSTSFMEDYGELINAVANLKSPTNKFNRQIDDSIFNIFVRYITDAIPRYERVDAGYRCKDAYLFASVPLSSADLGFIQPTDTTNNNNIQRAGYVNEETNPYLYNLCKNLDNKAQYNKIKRMIITNDNIAVSIYAADHECKTYILVRA